MKKKVLMLMMLFALTVISVIGCGAEKKNDAGDNDDVETELTAEEILERTADISMDAVACDLLFDMDVDMAIMGLDVNYVIDMDMQVEAERQREENNQKSHLAGTMNLEMHDSSGALNQTQSLNMESYVELDGDEKVTYSCAGENDWSVSSETVSSAENNISNSLKTALKQGFADKLKLKNNLEKISDTDCYVFSYTGSAKEFIEALGTTANMSGVTDLSSYGIDSDVFMESIGITCQIYISSEDFTIKKFVIDFDTIDFETLFDSMDKDLASLGIDEMELNSCTLSVNYKQIGNVHVEIPEEVKNIE